MPTKYSESLKLNIIHRYQKGESLKDLAAECHISLGILYRWRKEYCSIQTGQRTYTPKEFDSMQRKLQKLQHEMEIIRLCGLLTEVPLQKRLEKLENIHRHDYLYSVHELCEALGVDRGTFYNHIFRRADRTKHEEEQTRLMLLVQQIFDDNAQRFGANKIHAVLANTGIQVSAKRVPAIMRELGLRSVRIDAKKEYKKRLQAERKNLLRQDFSAERPNHVWVSDFTYFRVCGYWLYFCMVMDLYSRKIVGWQFFQNASTNLVTVAFRCAYQARGNPKGLTFHNTY